MRKFAIAGVAMLAIAATTAVYAQHSWFHDRMMGHTRMSVEDRAAMADAKIAAVHAGLKLSADQEKLWPPVESAVRDLVKIRMDRAKAREAQAAAANGNDPAARPDPVTRLRNRADRMAVNAGALKKIADAADPLYKTLDDGQKRRLAMLTHHHRHGGGGGWRGRFQRGMMGGEGGDDRGQQESGRL
jgi:LTXXQ motif family protein